MKYLLFAFAVLAATSQLSAEVMLQPPGLEAGDPYRLIFTTSQRTDGLSADVGDYNTFVQSVADAAPEVGDWGLDWTAIVSTPTVDARDNSSTNPLVDGVGVPIYRVDGQQFVNDYEHLWGEIVFNVPGTSMSAFSNLDITELGAALEPNPATDNGDLKLVFTGTFIDGKAFGASPLGVGELGNTGAANSGGSRPATDELFALGRNRPLSAELPLYAISQTITAVPEPDSHALSVGIFLIALVFRSTRRSLRK